MFKYFSYFQKLYKQKPSLCFSIFAACFLHVILFITSTLRPPPQKMPLQKLIVKTIVVPETLKPNSLSLQQKVKMPSPSQTTCAKPKPMPATKKQEPKKIKPSKTKQVLKELQENIAKIETKRDNVLPSQAIVVPKPIEALKADVYDIVAESSDKEESSYRDILVAYLKDTLHLPGYGTVKIRLTLEQQGEVQNLTIVASDSEVNRLYLENALQNLSFPSFSEELTSQKTHTFILTFCSDN